MLAAIGLWTRRFHFASRRRSFPLASASSIFFLLYTRSACLCLSLRQCSRLAPAHICGSTLSRLRSSIAPPARSKAACRRLAPINSIRVRRKCCLCFTRSFISPLISARRFPFTRRRFYEVCISRRSISANEYQTVEHSENFARANAGRRF